MPVKGGTKYKAAIDELAAKLAKPGTLRVGFLDNAKYPSGMPVAAVAAIQNFGAPRANIPPRPFFSNMVSAKKEEWGPGAAAVLKANKGDTIKTLGILGEVIKGQLIESIIATDSPPLRPITLMLRKMRSEDQNLIVTGKTVGEAARRVEAGESTAGVNTKVLDDTGFMLSRVDSEIAT